MSIRHCGHGRRRHFVLLILLLSAAIVFAGCTPKYEKLKQELLSAIENNQDIQSYRFHGKAVLHLTPLLHETDDALSAVLNGTWSWDGVADLSASKVETQLRLAPADADLSVQIPFLIEQSHLYFQLPFLNLPDEYWSLDMSEQTPYVGPGALGTAAYQALSALVEAVEGKRFDDTSEKGSTYKKVTIPLTQQNVPLILRDIKNAVPDILSPLLQAGIVTTAQSEQMKAWSEDPMTAERLQHIQFEEDGEFTFIVDRQGFIVGFILNLHYKPDETSPAVRIEVEYHLEDVNKTPEFTMETPAKTKPFDELLKQTIGLTAP